MAARSRAIVSPPPRRDVALAASCCALDLLMFSRVQVELADLALVAYAVVGYAFLAWRGRFPVAVFAAMWLHSVVAAVAIPDYRPVCGVLVALYTVTALNRLGAGLAALASSFLASGLGLAAELGESPSGRPLAAVLVAAAMLALFHLGAWLLGRWTHANRRRVLLLEQQREAAARAAVEVERGRLARELHDIIAHCVSVILLQAASDPDRAARALADIEHSGLQATGELRRLLGVMWPSDTLRGEGEPGVRCGLGDLEPLLDRMRTAGVPIRLQVRGEPALLDPSVDLSAYRVVQEALTNVAKHVGRGADTTVELRWETGMVHVSVTDDGHGQLDRSPVRLSTGNGLPGLRERAAAVGGHLHAGPLPGGGFRVSASLPVRGRAAAAQPGRSVPARGGVQAPTWTSPMRASTSGRAADGGA
jgi:signal transduction histidine kinase